MPRSARGASPAGRTRSGSAPQLLSRTSRQVSAEPGKQLWAVALFGRVTSSYDRAATSPARGQSPDACATLPRSHERLHTERKGKRKGGRGTAPPPHPVRAPHAVSPLAAPCAPMRTCSASALTLHCPIRPPGGGSCWADAPSGQTRSDADASSGSARGRAAARHAPRRPAKGTMRPSPSRPPSGRRRSAGATPE